MNSQPAPPPGTDHRAETLSQEITDNNPGWNRQDPRAGVDSARLTCRRTSGQALRWPRSSLNGEPDQVRARDRWVSRVKADVLHADNFPVLVLGDGVPDGHIVGK